MYYYSIDIEVTGCLLSHTGDNGSDDELSTGAAVTLSVLVTFLVTLVVTAMTTVILSTIYYKYWHEIDENVKANSSRIQENNQFILMGRDIKLNDPSRTTTQFDRDTTQTDTNPANAVTD